MTSEQTFSKSADSGTLFLNTPYIFESADAGIFFKVDNIFRNVHFSKLYSKNQNGTIMGYRSESHDNMNKLIIWRRLISKTDDIPGLASRLDAIEKQPLEPIDLPRFKRIREQKRDTLSEEDQRYYENFCSHDTMLEMDPPTTIEVLTGETYKECTDCGYSRTDLKDHC